MSEVLDFLKRDYPEYAWSLPTLDRRMRYFDITVGSLDSKNVTMIVQKISEKGLQIGKLPRTQKLEKRGAFLEQLPEKL